MPWKMPEAGQHLRGGLIPCNPIGTNSTATTMKASASIVIASFFIRIGLLRHLSLGGLVHARAAMVVAFFLFASMVYFVVLALGGLIQGLLQAQRWFLLVAATTTAALAARMTASFAVQTWQHPQELFSQ